MKSGFEGLNDFERRNRAAPMARHVQLVYLHLLLINNREGNSGYVAVTDRELMYLTQQNSRQVTDAKKQLRELGLIEYEGTRREGTQYAILHYIEGKWVQNRVHKEKFLYTRARETKEPTTTTATAVGMGASELDELLDEWHADPEMPTLYATQESELRAMVARGEASVEQLRAGIEEAKRKNRAFKGSRGINYAYVMAKVAKLVKKPRKAVEIKEPETAKGVDKYVGQNEPDWRSALQRYECKRAIIAVAAQEPDWRGALQRHGLARIIQGECTSSECVADSGEVRGGVDARRPAVRPDIESGRGIAVVPVMRRVPVSEERAAVQPADNRRESGRIRASDVLGVRTAAEELDKPSANPGAIHGQDVCGLRRDVDEQASSRIEPLPNRGVVGQGDIPVRVARDGQDVLSVVNGQVLSGSGPAGDIRGRAESAGPDKRDVRQAGAEWPGRDKEVRDVRPADTRRPGSRADDGLERRDSISADKYALQCESDSGGHEQLFTGRFAECPK